ncbi:MAG: hypothetical protein OEY96_06985 [Gammaproteobacteria bacterium]|nr:hypothetical protein [Gammaproteobacteria bacterium]
MALTIRTNKDDDKQIKLLMDSFNVGTASRALLMAAYEYPILYKEFITLKTDFQNLQDEVQFVIDAINRKSENQSIIDDFAKKYS